MSRTKKDRPFGVSPDSWEPFHSYCEHDLNGYVAHPCNLPSVPPKRYTHADRPKSGVRVDDTKCVWWPVYGPSGAFKSHVPRWFRHHVWQGRLRTDDRRITKLAKIEHNTEGCTDADEMVRYSQHRHNARWEW